MNFIVNLLLEEEWLIENHGHRHDRFCLQRSNQGNVNEIEV